MATLPMSKAAIFHDEEFYLHDIIFQVENRLFKVPRQLFVHQSQVFRDMLSLPVPPGTKADGTSDDQPLTLDGITAIDFIRLLRYLIPIKQSSDSHPLTTLDEWSSVFQLAALWDMEDVKEEAVEKMTPLLENQPAKQVKLSLEHDVGEWLIPGLQRLVQRAEPLNRDDFALIGLDYALKVMALREDCCYDRSYYRWAISKRGVAGVDVSAEIRTRFGFRS
ncbi:hypothetical protein F5887DRAFT_1081271 [Amanita rubescens]|nr:hypothetical protein F5887DRAFT_1081271 [Amanita rubescens]